MAAEASLSSKTVILPASLLDIFQAWFVRGAEGMESIELGIYNVDCEMVFLKEDDFGSLVA